MTLDDFQKCLGVISRALDKRCSNFAEKMRVLETVTELTRSQEAKRQQETGQTVQELEAMVKEVEDASS